MTRDTEEKNRSEYVVTVILAVKGEPMTYDEVAEIAEPVSLELRARGVDIPVLNDDSYRRSTTLRDVFYTRMKNLKSIGEYNPENWKTMGRCGTKTEYVLTRSGYGKLTRPAADVKGLTSEFEQEVRNAVYDVLDLGFRREPELLIEEEEE